MEIQTGRLYENRTWKYLYPCLKKYGATLSDYLGSFFKLAVGVGDRNFIAESNCIFILIDTEIPLSEIESERYRDRFSKFLDWLKYQSFYVIDYVYSDLLEGEKHMVVLKVPITSFTTYDYFIKGQYSKMYSEKEIKSYFKDVSIPQNIPAEIKVNTRLESTRKILKKDKQYLKTFVSIVNKDFKTTIEEKYFRDAELDYPLNLKEEIFNYGNS